MAGRRPVEPPPKIVILLLHAVGKQEAPTGLSWGFLFFLNIILSPGCLEVSGKFMPDDVFLNDCFVPPPVFMV
jgi:hypothetical protein